MVFEIAKGLSGVVRAFMIPPAADPAGKGEPLMDLSCAHAEAWDGEAMRRYVAALEAATPEQIEVARPQIFFTVDNVARRLADESMSVRLSIKDAFAPQALIREIARGTARDADRLLGECDRSPRSRDALRRCAGALNYLAEITAFCELVARKSDASLAPAAHEVRQLFDRISVKADMFRHQAAAHYPEVAEILPSTEQALATADTRIAKADFAVPRMSKAAADRLLGAIGDRSELWASAGDPSRRERRIAAGLHREIDARTAREIAAGTKRLMEDFDGVFNREGFVAELRKIAVVLRYESLVRIQRAHGLDEAEIRSERKGLHESQSERDDRVAEALARLPAERKRLCEAAAVHGAGASALADFLRRSGRDVADFVGPGFVSFRKVDGALVGELDVESEHALVIYDDHVVRRGDRHPEAVYAVRMPKEAMADGVPSLEDVREKLFCQATNYHSLTQCLGELDNDTECRFFFGGTRICGHDGYDVMEGALSLREPEMPHAPAP